MQKCRPDVICTEVARLFLLLKFFFSWSLSTCRKEFKRGFWLTYSQLKCCCINWTAPPLISDTHTNGWTKKYWVYHRRNKTTLFCFWLVLNCKGYNHVWTNTDIKNLKILTWTPRLNSVCITLLCKMSEFQSKASRREDKIKIKLSSSYTGTRSASI